MTPLCNLHTHSTFCDGENSPEENVLAAIEMGFSTLGFSGHSPTYVEGDEGVMSQDTVAEYKREILRLKEKYSDKIEIVLGIEQDSFTTEKNDGYEYVIGSVHHICADGNFVAVDWSYERLREGADRFFNGDMLGLAQEYYREVSALYEKTKCDIIGHFDIITKFNQKYGYLNENNAKYREMAISAADELLKTDTIFEVNTGGMAKGIRTIPYLPPFIVERIAEKGGRFILSSDAHTVKNLDYGFADALEYLKSLGVCELCIWKNGGFSSVKI